MTVRNYNIEKETILTEKELKMFDKLSKFF